MSHIKPNSILMKIMFAAAAVLFGLLFVKNATVLCTAILPKFTQSGAALALMLAALFLMALACFGLLLLARKMDANDKLVLPTWAYYAALFVLAYGLRAVWLTFVKRPPYSDYELFYWVTNQIALSPDPNYLQGVYFQTWAYQAGFPAFMSPLAHLFPAQAYPLLYANMVFEAGSVLCIFHLLRGFCKRNTAFVFACVYLLIPFPYMLVPVYTNQLSAMFFLLLGVCLLFPPKPAGIVRCCLAGLAFAMSNMLRAEGVLVLGAMCALIVFRLLCRSKTQPVTQRARQALPLAACCAVYLTVGMLLSSAFVWTGLNPHGLTNAYPLYKFAVGLHESNDGQYTKADADRLMGMNSDLPADVRDAETLRIIRDRLSIGPQRLLVLFSAKIDVMWTERDRSYPAFMAMPDDEVVAFPVVALRTETIRNGVALMQSLWNILLFLLAGFLAVRLVRKAEVAAPITFLYAMSGIILAVFLLIEAQKRYAYILLPFLFLLAMRTLPELHRLWQSRKK